jgi:DNA protecting protein DprA
MALPGIGRVTLERCIAREGDGWLDQDLGALLEQARGSLIPDPAGLSLAEREAGAQERTLFEMGIAPLFRGGSGYPPGLERLADPPRLIFLRGRAPSAHAVAVVGTREPSAWGLGEARRYAGALARAGIPVLNGLAPGIDRAALEAALALAGPCAGVLAAGHDVVERTSAGDLARRVLEAGGSLVSEYAPGVAAHKGSFIERDRIQAGLSVAVLVIESRPDGGTMHTARAAREAGVPLFALLPDDALAQAREDASRLAPGFRGPWSLIHAGAAVRSESPENFLAALGA